MSPSATLQIRSPVVEGTHDRLTELVARALALAREQGDARLGAADLESCRHRLPVAAYVRRFTQYGGKHAPTILLLALFYIGRAELQINSRNLYTVLTTAYAVADKFHSDGAFWNRDYARLGGISLRTLNRVEQEFLNAIGFDLGVDSNVLGKFREAITEAVGMTNDQQTSYSLASPSSEDNSSCSSSSRSRRSSLAGDDSDASRFRSRVSAAAGPQDGRELAIHPDLEVTKCGCVIA